MLNVVISLIASLQCGDDIFLSIFAIFTVTVTALHQTKCFFWNLCPLMCL
jgi:hypothetical protein